MKLTHIILGTVLLATSVARTQPYTIDWFTVDGGGRTSTGGVYAVSGTIGQPDAGNMTGGCYALDGGFWSLVAAVQMPGVTLTITRSGFNVVLCWPSSCTGFTLQQNANLSTTNWTNVALIPSDDGTNQCVTVAASPGNKFYRLKK